ncbi:hypothetical protein [Streptomyces sp. NPDC012888]|uniref:hypothetical protein n=1 Tax=Streptomyces sp. NPDC012888 TaxID=3364855 RepID=UPI0036792691
MNLRLTAIGAGVLIILSLPLAGAIAGPDFRAQDDGGKGGGLFRSLGLPEGSGQHDRSGSRADGSSGEEGTDGRGASDGAAGPGLIAPGPPGPPEQPRTESRCGPELSSPQGLKAQTCVLSGEGATWGRSYYRNTSGRELGAVLTLMGPAGRTLQIHCGIGAGDEPGLCETPKGPTVGEPADYTAVAEFAVPDEGAPLLLRSGSNSSGMGEG